MNMWKPSTPSEPVDFSFDQLHEMLYYFDIALTFVVPSTSGAHPDLYLAHWADTDGVSDCFVVVPVTRENITKMKKGYIDMRSVLYVEPIWWVVENRHEDTLESYSVTPSILPDDVFPDAGTLLCNEGDHEEQDI